jgi:hypothetical protein
MKGIIGLLAGGLALAGVVGFALGTASAEGAKKGDHRVFELRIYHAVPGKMPALHARFKDHTIKLFQKHGMTVVGFWVPTKPEEAEQKLYYILAYPSAESARKSWDGFRNDPEWKEVKAASEKDGTLVARVESVYLNPTDYSPMK